MALSEYIQQGFKEFFDDFKQVQDVLFTKDELDDLTRKFSDNLMSPYDVKQYILDRAKKYINEQ